MNREVHVRIRGGPGVRFPRATRRDPVGTPVLWVPAGPLLPRRDSNDLHHAARQESQAVMDSGRRPGRSIRPHRPRPATRHYRVVSRPGHDPAMAESRSDREGRFTPTGDGAPQGGVISPLLMNVALHGMEPAAGIRYRRCGDNTVETERGSPALVRYADLCRVRHKSAYADRRIMPTAGVDVLVSGG
jgi:hypothetical protein